MTLSALEYDQPLDFSFPAAMKTASRSKIKSNSMQHSCGIYERNKVAEFGT